MKRIWPKWLFASRRQHRPMSSFVQPRPEPLRPKSMGLPIRFVSLLLQTTPKLTAGTFLASFDAKVEIPPGFGTRHLAAAAVTKRTSATAVVVSATDGNVRAFSGGKMVLQLDPDVPYDLLIGDP